MLSARQSKSLMIIEAKELMYNRTNCIVLGKVVSFGFSTLIFHGMAWANESPITLSIGA